MLLLLRTDMTTNEIVVQPVFGKLPNNISRFREPSVPSELPCIQLLDFAECLSVCFGTFF